ncbi:MAG: hypothetical protein K6357_03565 [Elusimicrobiota bacterium]
MIIVINLNMAIDKTLKIDEFKKGYIYRKNPDVIVAGGKGVNVARALKLFVKDYLLIGFLCGHTGKIIDDMLRKEKFNFKMIYQSFGESRTCLSVIDKNGIATDINEEGSVIVDNSKKKFVNLFSSLVKKSNIVSISGRTPLGIDKSFYSNLIFKAKQTQAKVFVDLSGKALLDCLNAGVYCVKINAIEFLELASVPPTPTNLKKIYFSYHKRGLRKLIVTNKEKPVLAVTENGVYRAYPPKIPNFISGVGAGDSFMAGFIYSEVKGYSDEKSIALGISFALSDCKSLGAGIVDKKEIMRYFDKVRILKLEAL